MGASQREPASIVARRSIGVVRLGMSRSSLLGFYGSPAARRPSKARLGRIETYRVHGGALLIGYHINRVVLVATTSRYYTTPAGLGVGSTVPANRVVANNCNRAYPAKVRGSGLNVRARSRGGRARILSVSIAAPGYVTC
jgi:hypothetical protein